MRLWSFLRNFLWSFLTLGVFILNPQIFASPGRESSDSNEGTSEWLRVNAAESEASDRGTQTEDAPIRAEIATQTDTQTDTVMGIAVVDALPPEEDSSDDDADLLKKNSIADRLFAQEILLTAGEQRVSALEQLCADLLRRVSTVENPPKLVATTTRTAPTLPLPSSGSKIFTESGIFTPPPGVTQVRVLLMGGGASGGRGGTMYRGGGGSGWLNFGQVSITAIDEQAPIQVVVGKGGMQYWDPKTESDWMKGWDGQTSSFGEFISAEGGKTPAGPTMLNGGNGGSGGGAGAGSCHTLVGGKGGSFGREGANVQDWKGGSGHSQIKFHNLACFGSKFTAGNGGEGGHSPSEGHAGGGGAGGLLLEGEGPQAKGGEHPNAGKGGRGYGAGGGGGGYQFNNSVNFYGAPGEGASGVVYVEWGD